CYQASSPNVPLPSSSYPAKSYVLSQSLPTPMPSTSTSISKSEIAVVLPLPPAIKKKTVRHQWVIVIDPGHGGVDYGTNSLIKPKVHEKYLNLTTAEMLKKYLEQYGYKVVMTRNDDTFISLENRAEFANNLNTKLFVSVHYNSAPNILAEGVEVFYYRTDTDKSRVSESKLLAQCVLDKILKNTKANSRGVKHGNFAVIRRTKMPAILVEGGFLSNTEEMNKIKTQAYQKKIAQSIAQGIKDFLAKENVMAERK
nr:N-acetylmuramoyl-L-alanine amidase [Parachlamydiaceae bacterium]